MADSFPDKPKGMHWRTYEQLVADYEYQDAVSLHGLAGRLGLL